MVRRGYSLLELLIVLAVLTAVTGLAMPALRGTLDKARLTSAARDLQAAIAKTRALAIREGTAVELRMNSRGGTYVIERSDPLPDWLPEAAEDPAAAGSGLNSSAAASPETVQPQSVLREGRLPDGVNFGPELPAAGAVPVSAPVSSLPEPAVPLTAVTGDSLEWLPPVRFTAAGRTNNQTVRLHGQRGFVVDVSIRGLTGAATYSSPRREDAPSPSEVAAQGPEFPSDSGQGVVR